MGRGVGPARRRRHRIWLRTDPEPRRIPCSLSPWPAGADDDRRTGHGLGRRDRRPKFARFGPRRLRRSGWRRPRQLRGDVLVARRLANPPPPEIRARAFQDQARQHQHRIRCREQVSRHRSHPHGIARCHVRSAPPDRLCAGGAAAGLAGTGARRGARQPARGSRHSRRPTARGACSASTKPAAARPASCRSTCCAAPASPWSISTRTRSATTTMRREAILGDVQVQRFAPGSFDLVICYTSSSICPMSKPR